MQDGIKKHQLSKEAINELLQKIQTGSIATINADGSPYVIPVHFVHIKDCIYVHGSPKGQKIKNIQEDSRVSFTAYEMIKLLLDSKEDPCNTSTEYKSVVINGVANTVTNIEEKEAALKEVVRKYTPHLSESKLPENMVKGTAVIKIKTETMTGKYSAE